MGSYAELSKASGSASWSRATGPAAHCGFRSYEQGGVARVLWTGSFQTQRCGREGSSGSLGPCSA